MLALDTVTVGVGIVRSCIALGRREVHQDLIVAEVVRAMQLEVLVPIFGLQGQRNFPTKNHVHLSELLTLLHDRLISQIKAAIQR